MSFSFSNLTSKVAGFFDKLTAPNDSTTQGNKTAAPSFWQRNALNFDSWLANKPAQSDAALRELSRKVQHGANGSAHKTIAPFIKTAAPLDEPTRGFQPYELILQVPDNQETLSYEQIEREVIRDVFKRNNIGYSRASLEEVVAKEKLDLSPKYDYEKKVYEYNERDGLRNDKIKPEKMNVNGQQVRVVRLRIEPDVQRSIAANKALSETIKASGKKTFAELSLDERMKMAMQMAYDKHYAPHTVGEAVKDVDPRHLLAGVAVAGGIVYAASKAGASKALPLVGAGVTMAQVTYYYGEADHFLQTCKNAKSPEDLDKAAKTFGGLVKNGSLDVGLSLATAGLANIRRISKAGGALVGVAEKGMSQAWQKISRYSDEMAAGARKAFGEDLVSATVNNAPVTLAPSGGKGSTVLDELSKPMEVRRVGDPPAGSAAHKDLRWQQYQEENVNNPKAWDYERWSKSYDLNQTRASTSNAAVTALQQKLGWGKTEVPVTIEFRNTKINTADVPKEGMSGVTTKVDSATKTEVVSTATRRLDIADSLGKRAIEHKKGNFSLNESLRWELQRDGELVQQGWKITWHFDGYASKPLIDELKKVGIKVTYEN